MRFTEATRLRILASLRRMAACASRRRMQRRFTQLVEKTGLKNTQVVLAGDPAGGEGKAATKSRGKSAHGLASSSPRHHRNSYADTLPQRPRGGGFFRRLFGGF